MLTARLPVFVFLLYYCSSSLMAMDHDHAIGHHAMNNPVVPDLADDDNFTGMNYLNVIFCRYRPGGPRIRPGGCEKAISMIPSPYLHPEPDKLGTHDGTSAKFSLHRQPLGTPKGKPQRRYALPAAFRSGNCLILIHHEHDFFSVCNKMGGPPNAAFNMWAQVWPHVKEVAGNIVRECQLAGGEMLTMSQLEGYSLHYEVRVRPTPRNRGNPLPPEGHTVEFNDSNGIYNLYEEGGLWSGEATRGHWSQQEPEKNSVQVVRHNSI